MKKIFLMVSILALALIATYSVAQMSGSMMGEQEGMMNQMMPMMEKCQPMMKQMMGGEIMKQEMMQMMMEMMNMQEKMIMGAKAAEKKQMMKDMAQMKEKMQKMMSMGTGMMMGMDESQCRLKCAGQWLKKAINLHELHMKDPKTTTDASQMELMDQIKKAYDCITGTCSEMSVPPSKEVEGKEPQKAKPSKTDPHKH